MSTISASPPIPPLRTKGLALLATLASVVIVFAVLAMLLMNTAFTGMFFNRPPQGEGAMGLVVPFFGLAGAILALTLGGILAAFLVNTSAVGAISSSPFLSGLLVVILTLGGALAAGMAFMLWCEPGAAGPALRPITIPVGLALGIAGPAILAAMLLIGVWMSRSEAAAALASAGAKGVGLRAGFIAVCLLALAGYGVGGAMFWKEIQRTASNRAAALADTVRSQVEWASRERMPARQRLEQDLAQFSPTAPLWSIIAYLPDQPGQKKLDDECRQVVVERALKVADIDAELLECMQGRYYLYRQGAAEFLISAPDADYTTHRDAWGRALLAGLEATGDGIACRPAWLSETFDSKPDPLGHVRSLLKATDRFKGGAQYARFQPLLQRMANDAGVLNADSSRAKLLKMLAEAGFSASDVRPGKGD